jgi:hypothetical protein
LPIHAGDGMAGHFLFLFQNINFIKFHSAAKSKQVIDNQEGSRDEEEE